jgi:hypothetical protein
MRMKSKKRIVVSLLVLFLLAWTFRPYPTIDASKVHPSLRGLGESTECGWTTIGDGGSVIVYIDPSGGKEIVLCISNSIDQSFFERGELYIGDLYYTYPGSTKITNYDHTKYVVANLLAKSIPKQPSVRSVIALLTMRGSDWISAFVHGAGSPLW